MQTFCIRLASSPILYALANTADMAMFVTGIVILSLLLFRSSPVHSLFRYILCGAAVVSDGIFQSVCESGIIKTGDLAVHTETLIPFLCVFILYFSRETKKQFYKPVVAAIIYNITPVLSQIIKMFVPWINSDNSETSAAFGIDLVTDCVCFLILLAVFAVISQKRKTEPGFDKLDLSLCVLVILTVSIFVASLMFIDRYIKDTKINSVYFILLLNVPTFGFTIAYAATKAVRSKLAAESYKQILDENIRHYESLEAKNEELRIFRHDFPKTVSPLLMCIENGDTEEAQRILEEFNQTVQATRPRFSTGNSRLDNVLEVYAQKAEKLGILLSLENGSVFPQDGIDPIDVYTVFPNALDNAIEGSEKADGKEIRIRSKIAGGKVYVSISNACVETGTKRTVRNLISTKPDASLHGFGTKSIKKAVSKYGEDNIFFETDGGVFTLSFILNFAPDDQR